MSRAGAVAILACFAAVIAACGSSDEERPALPAARPLSTTICGPVNYGGEGHPQILIANSGALQGPQTDHGVQNAQAIKMVLAQRGWRAGSFTVGVQVCDETSAANPVSPSPAKCAANAKAFGAEKSVVAVLGPVTSTCARAMVPVANGAPGGPLPVVSMSNTYLGLTRSGPGVAAGDPDELYPTGERSFVRMPPADDLQAAASALYGQRLGVRRPYVLHNDEVWGVGLATAFRTAAERLGLEVAGVGRWSGRPKDFTRLAERVRRADADGVYLSGAAVDDNGGRLIKDLRKTLGPDVPLLAPDWFNEPAALVEAAGGAAEGVIITLAAIPNSELPAPGARFAREFKARFGSLPCCYAAYAAQAAHVLLDAIAASDGSRAGVLHNLFRTRIDNGLLGDFAIDRYGDTTLTKIAVYRLHGARLRLAGTESPSTDLLDRG
jgi:branched-chain amino acid transport system substrate-binding protein